jgi:hypothetical protein
VIRLVAAGLVVAAFGLAATEAWEVGAFAPPDRAAKLRPHASAAAVVSAIPPDHTNDWVTTILARPLFSPDRRPPAEASTGSGERLLGLPRLSGVLVGPFGRSAIFASDGGKALVVGEGGRVADWTVRVIEAGSVDVIGPDGARTLRPSFENMPQAAVGRPPAPARIGLSPGQ